MPGSDAPETPTPAPSSSRSRWLWVWAIIGALAIGAAFLGGTLVRSPWEQAVANSQTKPAVTAKVEIRQVSGEVVALKGTVKLGTELEVSSAPAEGARAVVTAAHAKVGATVKPGDVLAEVSGRPLIALALPFPLYRDLNPGAKGPDVKAVQQALAALGLFHGTADGDYGEATAGAVKRLYERTGATSPTPPVEATTALGDAQKAVTSAKDADPAARSEAQQQLNKARLATATPLPLAEVVSINADGATVVRATPAGTVLDGESATVVVLRSGQPQVVVRAGVDQVADFPVGTAVTLTSIDGGTSGTGKVAQVGEYRDAGGDDGAQLPGRDVTIAIDSSATFSDDSEVLIRPATTKAGEEGLAVPLVAVRSDSTAEYVLRLPASGDTKKAVRVPVKVVVTGDGYALLAPGAVKEGDTVLVSAGT